MEKRETQPIAKMKKSNPGRNYILFGFVLLLLPVLVELGIVQYSYITIIASILIYSIVSLGLNLLVGYSGLVSLGTAGFMGLGTYLAAYFTADLKLPFEVSLIISVAIPMVIGVITGLISLRIEGYYLAIATLAISEILRKVFVEFEFVTNGFSGKSASYPKLLGFFQLDRNLTYVLVVVVLVLVMLITHNFVNSYTGRALSTMRGSEAAAQAMGINIYRYRLLAFAVAVGFAALGGVMYMHFVKYTYPNTWTLAFSLNILAVIIIGGIRSIPGTIVGSFIVFGVPDLILKKLPVIGQIDGMAYIFNGLLIIIIILFYPMGLVHLWSDIKRKIFAGKRKGE
ncbi:branched-chain amino acid ABC transporter permease [Anaerocolumna aminovalerica]|uniref:Amino acid/amide ABC transporter membrane protein 2, HAAT family n=1 Tax=Anaerocolumna aminovalerica TaxID=1527 RepID=A0A1I5IW71_9FIRM|nr:branched-chain amino acid ABC transporter permease [Anaerocolumna aminovalerica]SFO64815.1 amino acid/amide ABC transporter membrane protein 2, HAAT family [Anaerocolumna aminovalerica]